MKEVRFFYVPDAATQTELPQEEATHALRVLRIQTGDELFLMDGKGCSTVQKFRWLPTNGASMR